MFQVFLETVTVDKVTRQIASHYGFPGPEMPVMITKGIREIYSVDEWKGFLRRSDLKKLWKQDYEGRVRD